MNFDISHLSVLLVDVSVKSCSIFVQSSDRRLQPINRLWSLLTLVLTISTHGARFWYGRFECGVSWASTRDFKGSMVMVLSCLIEQLVLVHIGPCKTIFRGYRESSIGPSRSTNGWSLQRQEAAT